MRANTTVARSAEKGFSLVELAVVMAIVAFLLGSLMYTLSAQTEQRNFEDTRRRLEQARELLLSFAIVNGRLPCPASSSSLGAESPSTGGDCTYYFPTTTNGYLPAASIGFQNVDSSGYAVDAWGNRIRYAVAKKVTNCSGTSTLPHFTNATNIKANGISCQSNDLLVCKSGVATGMDASASPPTCGASGANQIMATGLVAAIVFSTGKNGATGGTGTDEAANLDGNALFVFHTPTPSTAANGEFDDQFTWITPGELYGRLIAAGVLP
jgi:prepilin-type N-terminal cleavage/methylation domain-containing protein